MGTNNKILNEANFLQVLSKSKLDKNDFYTLIFADISEKAFEALAAKARLVTIQRFGMVKGLYIPLYLSNYCNNVCEYCGFSSNNKIERKTLTAKEILVELTDIFNKGFRNILLVSGEWNNFANIEYLKSAVEIVRKVGFHSISVELGALPQEYATMLTVAGAEAFVLYQETYHRPTYKKVHTQGKKMEYDYRIEGQARAIQGGFRKVSFGFLAGLYDVEEEAIEMFEHISYIKKKYWDAEIGISVPRITSAIGVDHTQYQVDDQLYARILMAYRLAFPEATISLSTRETSTFRDGMSDICVTHLSVESKTMPGGYHEEVEQSLEQFSVIDSRSLADMTKVLKDKGYDVHFKDWQRELS
ncbi:MAG: 2-iminoacetate synthase ThiH [bacterium]|nr:2-iminoacetate synthase ThiH [bacterium]